MGDIHIGGYPSIAASGGDGYDNFPFAGGEVGKDGDEGGVDDYVGLVVDVSDQRSGSRGGQCAAAGNHLLEAGGEIGGSAPVLRNQSAPARNAASSGIV